LYAPAGKSFRIELFRNWTPGPNGDKQVFIGSTQNYKDYTAEGPGGGIYTFEITAAQPILLGDVIAATATDENGNTSEFSPAIYAGVKTRVYGPVEQASGTPNRWVSNTTFRGLPVHWADGKAVFSIEDKFSDEPNFPVVPSGTDPVATAFSAWNGTGTPLLVSKALTPGPAEGWGGIPDGVNNIVWTEKFLEMTEQEFDGALAISRVRYNSFTGEIFDADVLINGGLVNKSKKYDLAAVLTHEIGHAGGGLGDIYDRNDQPYNLFMGTRPAKGDVTMYGIIKEQETYQTTINADDLAGLTYIFGNVAPSFIDLALVLDASQTYAAAYGAFEPSLDAALELVDRLRVGDGVAVVTFPGTDAGSTSAVPVPFQRIGSANPQAQKDAIKLAISQIVPAASDDRRPIGSALTAAAAALPSVNAGRRGVILFSAGNETETPSALDPTVLQKLVGSNPVAVFTTGYSQSPEGANIASKLADATGGLFYETDIYTISPVANHAWEVLTGQQLVLDKQAYSGTGQAISYKGSPTWQAISWKGATNTAISWKGNTSAALSGDVDEGSTGLYPAISWKGNTSVAKTAGTEATANPKFFLGLIRPDFNTLNYPYTFYTYPWANVSSDPPGTISPGNLPPGVEYVMGEAYAFYRITPQYTGKRDGEWILVPLGANETEAPVGGSVVINGRIATLTDVFMDVEFNKSNFLPTEIVEITVSLFEGGQVQASHTTGGGPITGAAAGIKAAVTLPDGSTATVPFIEVGNGVYTGTFVNTSAKGTYGFVVTAQGVAPVSGDFYFRKYDQSVYVAPAYASSSLLAKNSVVMNDGSKVVTGDVLVNNAVPPGSQSVSLRVGAGASTAGGYNLFAYRLEVLAGGSVASSVFTGVPPINAGTITGAVKTGVGFPILTDEVINEIFPATKSATGDFAPNYSVSTGSTSDLILESGVTSYGAVSLEPGSTLRLNPGVYNFRS
ncbi:MAG: hypothetical protein H6Q28_1426, partial [Bacteroidetes bacterium]|nr:hypothetical protein [Bacteroidota bacterium]